jgi:hypothetical protein
MFRADVRFTVGQRIETECITAEITDVDRTTGPTLALPTAVRFTLHGGRPDCSLAIMAWSPEGFVPWQLPAIGACRQLEPAVLF